MAAGMDANTSGDEELARLAGHGDEAAFAELYHRHFPALYDYALRLSRDKEVAALVVQASFLNVYGALASAEPQSPLKLQLFAAAHGDLPQRLRARRGEAKPTDEPFAATDPSRTDPALEAAPGDFAPTVWQAASSMRLEDYELLDLSVRQGFDAQEIATVLRTRPESVETRLGRASETFDAALSAAILMDLGRRACVDLDFEVGTEEWSEALGRRIARHQEKCQTCQATQQDYPRGTKLLAALTPVPAPKGWQQTMLGRLQDAARAGRIPAVAGEKASPAAVALGPLQPGEGLADRARRFFGGPRGPMAIALGGGMLLIILVLAGLCGAGAFDGGGADATPTPTATVTGTSTVTSTPTTSPTATQTPTGTVEVVPATDAPPPSLTPLPTSTALATQEPTETSAPPTEPPPSATPVATATAKPPPAPTETDVPATPSP